MSYSFLREPPSSRMSAVASSNTTPMSDLLSAFLRRLEQGQVSSVEIVMEIADTPEAHQAGVMVLGLSELQRSRALSRRPVAPSIDPARKQYSVQELVEVPRDVFLINLYRCLLKRDPDSGGLAHFTARWHSGAASSADVVYEVASSPEARRTSIAVTGLGMTRLRRTLSTLPVIGRLVDILGCILYLPELAQLCRRLAQRSTASETRWQADVLRVESRCRPQTIGARCRLGRRGGCITTATGPSEILG